MWIKKFGSYFVRNCALAKKSKHNFLLRLRAINDKNEFLSKCPKVEKIIFEKVTWLGRTGDLVFTLEIWITFLRKVKRIGNFFISLIHLIVSTSGTNQVSFEFLSISERNDTGCPTKHDSWWIVLNVFFRILYCILKTFRSLFH